MNDSVVRRYAVAQPPKADLILSLVPEHGVEVTLRDLENRSERHVTLLAQHPEGDASKEVRYFGTTTEGETFNLVVPLSSDDEPTISLPS